MPKAYVRRHFFYTVSLLFLKCETMNMLHNWTLVSSVPPRGIVCNSDLFYSMASDSLIHHGNYHGNQSSKMWLEFHILPLLPWDSGGIDNNFWLTLLCLGTDSNDSEIQSRAVEMQSLTMICNCKLWHNCMEFQRETTPIVNGSRINWLENK